MNGLSLCKNEYGENKMIDQKLVSQSFFHILKVCYQTAGNSSLWGLRAQPKAILCAGL